MQPSFKINSLPSEVSANENHHWLTFGSVCSGIEAASVAWEPLGWKAAFYSEVGPFPRAILSHHYPDTPLHGDFTTIQASQYGSIDLLVGGTPCQSFSIAGLRGGLDDERGNLALEYLRLAQRLRPRWLVWENVSGVLSSNGGRDFGAIIGGMVELGYGVAYRMLDAQFFGVAQRRRRVFAVGYLGDWRRAATVLFERHSLQGHPAPLRQEPEHPALSARERAPANDGLDRRLIETSRMPPKAYSIMPQNSGKDYKARAVEVAQPLMAAGPVGGNQGGDVVLHGDAVRRFTLLECERLQGFPDDYTAIPWRGKSANECPDGPRYKALGNSMAVPVMAWLGRRISAVERIANTAVTA